MSNVVKTATSATTCSCCGGGTLATLSSRNRSGTATLCGNSENTGFASTPPKKYRKKRTSGTMSTCSSSAPCTTPSTFIQQKWIFHYNSGNDYNSGTCALTNFNSNFTEICTSGPPPPPVTICPTTGCATGGIQQPTDSWKLAKPGGNTCYAFNTVNGIAVYGPPTTSAIQNIVTLVNFCCSSGGGGNLTTNGTIVETLSDEDTDADAYARAAPTFTWSAFTTAPDSGVATQTVRTTGFSFILTDVEFKVDGSGFTPGSSHSVNIQVMRAIAGSGVYTLFQTLVYSVVADGSGNISFTDSVPNASGFDTFVTNPRVF